MSFIRSKIINGHTYYYRVHSVRDGKTVRQVHEEYIGKYPGGRDHVPEEARADMKAEAKKKVPESILAHRAAKAQKLELTRETNEFYYYGNFPKKRFYIIRALDDQRGYHLFPQADGKLPRGYPSKSAAEKDHWGSALAAGEVKLVSGSEASKYPVPKRYGVGSAKAAQEKKTVVPKIVPTEKKVEEKRMNYKKLTPTQAQEMIDKSHGMPKAKWERLWKIAHSPPQRTATTVKEKRKPKAGVKAKPERKPEPLRKLAGRGTLGSANWGVGSEGRPKEELDQWEKNLKPHIGKRVYLTGGGGSGIHEAKLAKVWQERGERGPWVDGKGQMTGPMQLRARLEDMDPGFAGSKDKSFEPIVDSWQISAVRSHHKKGAS